MKSLLGARAWAYIWGPMLVYQGCMSGIRPNVIEPPTEVSSRTYAQPPFIVAQKTALAMYALGWILDAKESQPPNLIEATAPASPSAIGGHVWAMITPAQPEGTMVILIFAHGKAPPAEKKKNEERVRQLFDKIETMLGPESGVLPKKGQGI